MNIVFSFQHRVLASIRVVFLATPKSCILGLAECLNEIPEAFDDD